MKHLQLDENGFTLTELIVSMAIGVILLGFVTINLLGFQRKSSLDSAVSTLVADIRTQQIKAMEGDTEGRATHDNYGVHFGTTNYTLFHGSVYSPSDTTNLAVNLAGGLQFTNILFPSSNVIFSGVSGEVSGFANGFNAVTVKFTESGDQQTIQINRYGVVTNVN